MPRLGPSRAVGSEDKAGLAGDLPGASAIGLEEADRRKGGSKNEAVTDAKQRPGFPLRKENHVSFERFKIVTKMAVSSSH
jgi:hypothetical protein